MKKRIKMKIILKNHLNKIYKIKNIKILYFLRMESITIKIIILQIRRELISQLESKIFQVQVLIRQIMFLKVIYFILLVINLILLGIKIKKIQILDLVLTILKNYKN